MFFKTNHINRGKVYSQQGGERWGGVSFKKKDKNAPGNSEVDQGCLSLQLGLVVRVCQFGLQDKPEVFVVLHFFVTHL